MWESHFTKKNFSEIKSRNMNLYVMGSLLSCTGISENIYEPAITLLTRFKKCSSNLPGMRSSGHLQFQLEGAWSVKRTWDYWCSYRVLRFFASKERSLFLWRPRNTHPSFHGTEAFPISLLYTVIKQLQFWLQYLSITFEQLLIRSASIVRYQSWKAVWIRCPGLFPVVRKIWNCFHSIYTVCLEIFAHIIAPIIVCPASKRPIIAFF